MKKYKILILVLFLAMIVITPCLVWGQVTNPVTQPSVTNPVTQGIFKNPLKADSLTDLLAAMLDVVVQVGLVVIVFFIIFAGFQFVTARGDTGKITKAREALVAVLIGSAIVLGSYAIATALKNTVEQLSSGVTTYQLEETINFKV
ncbi:MAG: hypothetical protein WC531_03035 [Candidatus Paceibacterota bacterium]|jgi:hypothetical protein